MADDDGSWWLVRLTVGQALRAVVVVGTDGRARTGKNRSGSIAMVGADGRTRGYRIGWSCTCVARVGSAGYGTWWLDGAVATSSTMSRRTDISRTTVVNHGSRNGRRRVHNGTVDGWWSRG